MKKRVLLLMNSISGKASGRREFFPIVSDLAKDGCEVTVYPIIPGTELTSENIIHERGRDFDVIACCGGDGTLNHVINAIMAGVARTGRSPDPMRRAVVASPTVSSLVCLNPISIIIHKLL